jgi:hypothetical protein
VTTLRASTVFADEKLTVTVIESLELSEVREHFGRLVTVNLKPVAVIVRQPGRTYALDMDAQLLDMDTMDLPADFDGAAASGVRS